MSKGLVGDGIACEEMMEIIRWENEGGRIEPANSTLGGANVAKRLLLTYMEETTNDNFYPGARYRMD